MQMSSRGGLFASLSLSLFRIDFNFCIKEEVIMLELSLLIGRQGEGGRGEGDSDDGVVSAFLANTNSTHQNVSTMEGSNYLMISLSPTLALLLLYISQFLEMTARQRRDMYVFLFSSHTLVTINFQKN